MRNGHDSWVHTALASARNIEPTDEEVGRVLADATVGVPERGRATLPRASRSVVLAFLGVLLVATTAAAVTGLLPVGQVVPGSGKDAASHPGEDPAEDEADRAVSSDLKISQPLPPNAVAIVGDEVITKRQFNHWYESNAYAHPLTGGPGVVRDPPGYDDPRHQVMQFLIQSRWLLQEAQERGVRVKDGELQRLLERKKRTFPNEKDYRTFLRSAGASEQDLVFRIKLDTLQSKLTAKVQKDQEKVTDADVEAYYEKTKQRFLEPERRSLNTVVTKDEAKAVWARRQLDHGASFEKVSRDLAKAGALKAHGKLVNVVRRNRDKTFDNAVFEADPGEIAGPVKARLGWYVFQVTRVVDASQLKLADVKEAIRSDIRSKRQDYALHAFIADFRLGNKSKTKCRTGLVIAECGNASDDTPIPR